VSILTSASGSSDTMVSSLTWIGIGSAAAVGAGSEGGLGGSAAGGGWFVDSGTDVGTIGGAGGAADVV